MIKLFCLNKLTALTMIMTVSPFKAYIYTYALHCSKIDTLRPIGCGYIQLIADKLTNMSNNFLSLYRTSAMVSMTVISGLGLISLVSCFLTLCTTTFPFRVFWCILEQRGHNPHGFSRKANNIWWIS